MRSVYQFFLPLRVTHVFAMCHAHPHNTCGCQPLAAGGCSPRVGLQVGSSFSAETASGMFTLGASFRVQTFSPALV